MKIDPELSALGILGDADDDTVTADVPDPFTKLFQDAELGAALHVRGADAHVEAFHVETAERSTAVAAHYRKLARDAEKQPDAGGSLEKRAKDPRVAKIQETKIGSRIVVAELDENNFVLRTYQKEAA
jgi:hypothetical protein